MKSLLLMHCSDREKIEAAPQHRLQLNLEEKSLIFNELNKSLPALMASLSYLLLNRWAKTGRSPTMADINVLQS